MNRDGTFPTSQRDNPWYSWYWWACFGFAWKVIGTMYSVDRMSVH